MEGKVQVDTTNWTPVEDGLPEHGADVLLVVYLTLIQQRYVAWGTCYHSEERARWYIDGLLAPPPHKVTHWLALPALPPEGA